jgi:hypothetical protein
MQMNTDLLAEQQVVIAALNNIHSENDLFALKQQS